MWSQASVYMAALKIHGAGRDADAVVSRPQRHPPYSVFDHRGTVIIEFAVVSFLLVGLVCGISDASAAFRIKQVLHTATREGARVAAVTTLPAIQKNDPRIINLVVNQVLQDGHVDLRRSESFVTIFDVNNNEVTQAVVGDRIVVEVIHRYVPILAFGIPGVYNGPFVGDLRSSTAMRYQGDGSSS